MKIWKWKRLLSCLALMGILMVSPLMNANALGAEPIEIQPRYTGVTFLSADLTINGIGYADCYGYVVPSDGYRVYLTVSLEQDGTEIMSWTDSGSDTFTVNEGLFVESGYDYQVIVTAVVRDLSDMYITTYTAESVIIPY